MAAIAFYEWLQSERNYQSGLELYLAHGTNGFLKKILSTGESTYNLEKLTSEIEALAADPKPKSNAPQAASPSFSGKYPPEVQALVDRRVQLFKESSHLHGKLQPAKDQEERHQLATTILDNFDCIDALWDQITYFDEHGVLPPDFNSIPTSGYETDPARMRTRLTTVRTYISRDKDNPKKAEKVTAWRQELAHYERELGK